MDGSCRHPTRRLNQATAASRCSTYFRDGLFERTVGHTYIQLDRLSGLKRFSLSGNHIHRPCDMIDGLAGLIANSPQLVHLEVKVGCKL